MEFREISDKTKWNEFVNNLLSTDILQSWEWGEVKRIEGWTPYRFALEESGELVSAIQIMVKQVRFLGKLAYAPHAPVLSSKYSNKQFKDFLVSKQWDVLETGLIAWAKANGIFAIEIEPKVDERDLVTLKSLKWDITKRNRQPKYKLFMDITKSEEEIKAGMKKSTRYNISYAEKKGVVIKKYTVQQMLTNPEILDRFYDLMLDMQKRAEYPIRSKGYFQKFFEEFKDTNAVLVFEASYQGDVMAMNISEYTNVWASSFYAGSNRLHPNLKSAYLLRWESIKEAKSRGCQVYDFWGIVPESKQHKGYSDHKLSFGGERVDFVGILICRMNFKALVWDLYLNLQKLLVKFKYS
jgi:peptidoglycan pentaglycine glycine transferase (the first glycine)